MPAILNILLSKARNILTSKITIQQIMYIIRFIFLMLAVCIALGPLYADDAVSRWGIAPIAAPYYTPDTGWGLGAYIVTYINPPAGSSFSTPDELSFYAAYTEKNQATFGLIPNIFFNDGLVKLSGKGEINRYPTAFWGIGPHTERDAEEIYTPVEVWDDLALLLRTWGSFYIGPMIHVRFSRIEDIEPGGIIDSNAIPGSDGTREIGPGVSFQYDSRNSIFYPTDGVYIEGKSSFNRRELSSEYNFSRYELDARWFAGITGEHVIAFQVKARMATGEVPLQSLCGIGGNEIMRGYMKDRYLDKTSLSGQVEYRFPIAWRFSGVIFAAAGEVQEKPADYSPDDIHYTGGAGLRLIIDRAQHISARADCGVDENGTLNYYLLAKEAF